MTARSPKIDKDGLTLPAWALSFVVLLLGWGVTLEVRLGRTEDRTATAVERLDAVDGDHDRLVAIEIRLGALLSSQERLVAALSSPSPTPSPTPTGRGSFDPDGSPDP